VINLVTRPPKNMPLGEELENLWNYSLVIFNIAELMSYMADIERGVALIVKM